MTFDDWWGAYPTQEDYEANCRDAWEASAASRDDEVAELHQQLAEVKEEKARGAAAALLTVQHDYQEIKFNGMDFGVQACDTAFTSIS